MPSIYIHAVSQLRRHITKFTHSFKVYHSVDFSVLTGLYSHHHGQFGNIFITLKRNPIPTSSHFPFSLQPHPSPKQPHLLFLWICLFWTFCINGIIQYVPFYI